jgi:hypothetical protein
MTEFETLVINELSDIKSVGTATAQQVTSLENRLFDGPSSVISNLQADIAEIKAARESQAKWDRVHNILHYTIGPALITIQAIARKYGAPV